MNNPLISIVIPTKNSSLTLSNCLQTIKGQTYGNYEIIIVDAFSKDGTKKIAESFGARYFASSDGPSGARNLGFSKANGSIFVSIDSDMLLDKNLLGEASSLIGTYDALIFPEVGYGTDFVSRCKDLEKRCYIGDSTIESCRAFKKEAFNAVGGYDSSLHFGEDWDLNSRIANLFRIGRTNARIMHDTRSVTIRQDLKKAYMYGSTLRHYLAKKNPQSRKWLAFRNLFFIKHFWDLAKEPIEGIGITVIKSAEYSAGLLGYVSSYIFPKENSIGKADGK